MILNSKINKKPLFLIKKFFKKKNFKNRYDLTDKDKFLQISFLNLKRKKVTSPHIHLNLIKKTNISQESWIVMEGKLNVRFYDLDNKKIKHLGYVS